jgi:negative regulator of flagellin synthesis FlgM
MKIDDSRTPPFLRSGVGTADSGPSAPGAKVTRAPQGRDTSCLSEAAREIQAARRLLEEIPDVDETRVEELRKAVASGDYRVDPRGLADRLLRESLLNDS